MTSDSYDSSDDMSSDSVREHGMLSELFLYDYAKCSLFGFVTRGIPMALGGWGMVHAFNRYSRRSLGPVTLSRTANSLALIGCAIGTGLYVPTCWKIKRDQIREDEKNLLCDSAQGQKMRYNRPLQSRAKTVREQIEQQGLTIEQQDIINLTLVQCVGYFCIPLTAIVYGGLFVARKGFPWYVGSTVGIVALAIVPANIIGGRRLAREDRKQRGLT